MNMLEKTRGGGGLKLREDKQSATQRELQEIIDRCRAIEEKGLNPFVLDVDSIVNVVRKLFPSWENPEELSLDAETVHRVASVIRLQSEWLQRRSTSLYMDPLIVAQRLKELSREELAEAFVSSWRPLLESEAITKEALFEAMDYWSSLPALAGKWPQLLGTGTPAAALSRQEFLKSSLLDEETFESRLENLYGDLKRRAARDKIAYWSFVLSDSFEETVERSYLASFLVSYGWATLHVHPIEGEIFIQALAKNSTSVQKKMPTSVVLRLSKEEYEQRLHTR